MTPPKIVATSVEIKYRADDGYSSTTTYSTTPTDTDPGVVLCAALEELARLTALFGYEDQALHAFEGARARVAEFKARLVAEGEPVQADAAAARA